MYISKLNLYNYKSYHQSESLHLLPGINLIVGQNNAGKSALLEGLSLNFQNKPYKSSRLLRAVTNDKPTSSVIVTLTLSNEELLGILKDIPAPFHIPLPEKVNYIDIEPLPPGGHEKKFLRNTFRQNSYTFEVQVNASDGENQILHNRFPSLALYNAARSKDRRRYAVCELDEHNELMVESVIEDQKDELDFGLLIIKTLKNRIYNFNAERFSLGQCETGLSDYLKPDASNLAEVLANLQGRQPSRFRQLNKHLNYIFPQLFEISVRPNMNRALYREIIIYEVETESEMDAIPLSDCGTGLGQILAMLYVMINSTHAQSIIIDEPQSFLHPGAVRKLIEVFQEHPQHQYIIATHLPVVIAACNPSTITLVKKERGEQTTFKAIDINETKDLSICLDEVGARLSDVFGVDNILWVEGPTERDCFPMILEHFTKIRLKGTEIVPVLSTDEILGKTVDRVVGIYQMLSQGKGLRPPAIGFIFDRECRNKSQRTDLERKVGGLIKFIPRRMFENYLLNPEAIAFLMNELPDFSKKPITKQKVSRWLGKKKKIDKYYCNKTTSTEKGESWLHIIHGAELLTEIFSEFSNARYTYKKVEHGVKLTQWLLKNHPNELKEIADLMEMLLTK